MSAQTPSNGSSKNSFLALAILTCLVLLVPLTAMLLTDKVIWNAVDFIVMGLLLFSMGSLSILISHRVQRKMRVAINLFLTAIFLYLWAELAVGIFTNLGN
jgi:hypothetical protein